MKVDLEELSAALEDHTGEVGICVDEEITGYELPLIVEGRHVFIEPLPSWHGYQDMKEFTNTVGAEELRERLWQAIEGRGAFRRFQDPLRHHPDERQAWLAFEDARKRERSRAWLSEHGIEVDE